MYEIYKRLRDAKGVTDYAVAKACGLKQTTFTEWEKVANGEKGHAPKIDKLLKIARYFDVSLDYLVTGKSRGGAPSIVLTDSERRLLAAFRELNDDAQAFLLDNALLLASSDKYKKAPSAASA